MKNLNLKPKPKKGTNSTSINETKKEQDGKKVINSNNANNTDLKKLNIQQLSKKALSPKTRVNKFSNSNNYNAPTKEKTKSIVLPNLSQKELLEKMKEISPIKEIKPLIKEEIIKEICNNQSDYLNINEDKTKTKDLALTSESMKILSKVSEKLIINESNIKLDSIPSLIDDNLTNEVSELEPKDNMSSQNENNKNSTNINNCNAGLKLITPTKNLNENISKLVSDSNHKECMDKINEAKNKLKGINILLDTNKKNKDLINILEIENIKEQGNNVNKDINNIAKTSSPKKVSGKEIKEKVTIIPLKEKQNKNYAFTSSSPKKDSKCKSLINTENLNISKDTNTTSNILINQDKITNKNVSDNIVKDGNKSISSDYNSLIFKMLKTNSETLEKEELSIKDRQSIQSKTLTSSNNKNLKDIVNSITIDITNEIEANKKFLRQQDKESEVKYLSKNKINCKYSNPNTTNSYTNSNADANLNPNSLSKAIIDKKTNFIYNKLHIHRKTSSFGLDEELKKFANNVQNSIALASNITTGVQQKTNLKLVPKNSNSNVISTNLSQTNFFSKNNNKNTSTNKNTSFLRTLSKNKTHLNSNKSKLELTNNDKISKANTKLNTPKDKENKDQKINNKFRNKESSYNFNNINLNINTNENASYNEEAFSPSRKGNKLVNLNIDNQLKDKQHLIKDKLNNISNGNTSISKKGTLAFNSNKRNISEKINDNSNNNDSVTNNTRKNTLQSSSNINKSNTQKQLVQSTNKKPITTYKNNNTKINNKIKPVNNNVNSQKSLNKKTISKEALTLGKIDSNFEIDLDINNEDMDQEVNINDISEINNNQIADFNNKKNKNKKNTFVPIVKTNLYAQENLNESFITNNNDSFLLIPELSNNTNNLNNKHNFKKVNNSNAMKCTLSKSKLKNNINNQSKVQQRNNRISILNNCKKDSSVLNKTTNNKNSNVNKTVSTQNNVSKSKNSFVLGNSRLSSCNKNGVNAKKTQMSEGNLLNFNSKGNLKNDLKEFNNIVMGEFKQNYHTEISENLTRLQKRLNTLTGLKPNSYLSINSTENNDNTNIINTSNINDINVTTNNIDNELNALKSKLTSKLGKISNFSIPMSQSSKNFKLVPRKKTYTKEVDLTNIANSTKGYNDDDLSDSITESNNMQGNLKNKVLNLNNDNIDLNSLVHLTQSNKLFNTKNKKTESSNKSQHHSFIKTHSTLQSNKNEVQYKNFSSKQSLNLNNHLSLNKANSFNNQDMYDKKAEVNKRKYVQQFELDLESIKNLANQSNNECIYSQDNSFAKSNCNKIININNIINIYSNDHAQDLISNLTELNNLDNDISSFDIRKNYTSGNFFNTNINNEFQSITNSNIGKTLISSKLKEARRIKSEIKKYDTYIRNNTLDDILKKGKNIEAEEEAQITNINKVLVDKSDLKKLINNSNTPVNETNKNDANKNSINLNVDKTKDSADNQITSNKINIETNIEKKNKQISSSIILSNILKKSNSQSNTSQAPDKVYKENNERIIDKAVVEKHFNELNKRDGRSNSPGKLINKIRKKIKEQYYFSENSGLETNDDKIDS